MNPSYSELYEAVTNQQMELVDAFDDLASAWEDALSSVTEQSSYKQQSMIW
jgi:hypothetical protein